MRFLPYIYPLISLTAHIAMMTIGISRKPCETDTTFQNSVTIAGGAGFLNDLWTIYKVWESAPPNPPIYTLTHEQYLGIVARDSVRESAAIRVMPMVNRESVEWEGVVVDRLGQERE